MQGRVDIHSVSIHRVQGHGAKSDRGKAPVTDEVLPSSATAMMLSMILSRVAYNEQQQIEYFKYAKKRDAALIKSLQRNFTRPTVPFPEFPDAILKEWTIPLPQDDPTPSDENSEE